MILEVNSSPGLEGIQRATSIDVADAVIRHVEREATPASAM
jgi:ribosomal protein S6--L-glutamate ligase